jgi:hypothetical protein
LGGLITNALGVKDEKDIFVGSFIGNDYWLRQRRKVGKG